MAKVCVPVRRCPQRRARGLVPRLPEGLIDLYGLCRPGSGASVSVRAGAPGVEARISRFWIDLRISVQAGWERRMRGLPGAVFADGALTTHVWRTDDPGIVRAAWVRQTSDGGFRVERGWMVRCRRNGRAGWARAAACTAGGRA